MQLLLVCARVAQALILSLQMLLGAIQDSRSSLQMHLEIQAQWFSPGVCELPAEQWLCAHSWDFGQELTAVTAWAELCVTEWCHYEVRRWKFHVLTHVRSP